MYIQAKMEIIKNGKNLIEDIQKNIKENNINETIRSDIFHIFSLPNIESKIIIMMDILDLTARRIGENLKNENRNTQVQWSLKSIKKSLIESLEENAQISEFNIFKEDDTESSLLALRKEVMIHKNKRLWKKNRWYWNPEQIIKQERKSILTSKLPETTINYRKESEYFSVLRKELQWPLKMPSDANENNFFTIIENYKDHLIWTFDRAEKAIHHRAINEQIKKNKIFNQGNIYLQWLLKIQKMLRSKWGKTGPVKSTIVDEKKEKEKEEICKKLWEILENNIIPEIKTYKEEAMDTIRIFKNEKENDKREEIKDLRETLYDEYKKAILIAKKRAMGNKIWWEIFQERLFITTNDYLENISKLAAIDPIRTVSNLSTNENELKNKIETILTFLEEFKERILAKNIKATDYTHTLK